MKRLLTLFAMFVVMTMISAPTVKAQDEKPIQILDTIPVIASPVFSGAEQNLTDSIIAIANAATSAEAKLVLTDAVAVIKDTPKEGGLEAWYGWIVAACSALFGIYQYVRKRTQPHPVTGGHS